MKNMSEIIDDNNNDDAEIASTSTVNLKQITLKENLAAEKEDLTRNLEHIVQTV